MWWNMESLKTSLKTILIVSNDAGGANILALWCKQWHKKLNFIFKLSGPAVLIFRNEFPDLVNNEYYPSVRVLQGVLTSTGWQSRAEFDAIAWAKENSIPVASYLDHWVNFKSRFERNKQCIFPDEIWCADKESKEIATREFIHLNIAVRYIRNRYFFKLQRMIKTNMTNDSHVLICLEPIRDGIKFEEVYTNLALFLQNSEYRGFPLLIRDHPSLTDTGLSILISKLKSKFNINVSQNELWHDLSGAVVVVGYQSAVLAYAGYLNIEVISYFPVDKMEPILPHKVIQYI